MKRAFEPSIFESFETSNVERKIGGKTKESTPQTTALGEKGELRERRRGSLLFERAKGLLKVFGNPKAEKRGGEKLSTNEIPFTEISILKSFKMKSLFLRFFSHLNFATRFQNLATLKFPAAVSEKKRESAQIVENDRVFSQKVLLEEGNFCF